MKYTIIMDVDSVCADLNEVWLGRYNADYHDTLTANSLSGWDMIPVVKPECGEKIYDYLLDPDLYDWVKPIPGSQDGIQLLRAHGHRIVFATSTPQATAGVKYYWLKKHGYLANPEAKHTKEYVEIGDKSILHGDVMLDDAPHHVASFCGLGVLYYQPHNAYFDWPMRVKDWSEFLDLMERDPLPVGTHITELTRPKQTRAYKELLKRKYEVHLDKNADYSPANILGVGEMGLMTRTWDKVSRLMNLMGFKIEIASAHYEQPCQPKNESIDDSVLDASIYFDIWQIFRRGAWGK